MLKMGMISWSPSIQILRHCNVAKIIMPVGSMLGDFRLETIKYGKCDIEMEFLHKDHFLRCENDLQSPYLKIQEVDKPIYLF